MIKYSTFALFVFGDSFIGLHALLYSSFLSRSLLLVDLKGCVFLTTFMFDEQCFYKEKLSIGHS